jgi:hypothetical protein
MKTVLKTFIVDDYVTVQGWKKFQLNLNYYRNAHYQVLNKAKIQFKNNLIYEYPELACMGQASEIFIEYTVVPNNKRKFDTGNLISIVEKFFLDALVDSGVIEDDNYTIVKETKTKPVEEIDVELKNKKIIIDVTLCYKE